MPFQGQICARGVWDESVPNITFNEKGVSNYAQLYDKLVEAYPRGEKGQSDWDAIVHKIKTNGKGKRYDCIIGVSGGTDSSYLLHLAKELGLRPLAVNLDNGWNSDIAVKNIKKMTTALDIDLETYVVNYEEIKDLIKSYMQAGLPWIDIPTDLAIKSVLYKLALRENIKFILRGNDFRSEGSQPTEWTYGDNRQLTAIHRKFGKIRIRTFPNISIIKLVYCGFVKGIKSVFPFYYLNYDKNEAQKLLISKYGWEYYGGHHYENIFTRFVMCYWLYEKFGIDKRKITLSAQVLSGQTDRKIALETIAKKPYNDDEVKDMISYVAKKLDLSLHDFEILFQNENHTFHAYPSYSFIFTHLLKIARPLLKMVFDHKPQSIFKSEIIDK